MGYLSTFFAVPSEICRERCCLTADYTSISLNFGIAIHGFL
jgi:hypothetical protein